MPLAQADPPLPKWADIRAILIIAPEPIVIGQTCELGYWGVQGCKALRGEG